jgi:hypothetical protein
MTATTVELNPGLGGAKSLHDSLTTLDGVAAPTGAVAQMVKLVHGPANAAESVSHGSGYPVTPANITTKFRESFEVYAPNSGGKWLETKHSADFAFVDGNAAGASYLVVSKSPLTPDTETEIETVLNFALPVEVAFGLSMSQRTLGQQFSVEFVDTQAPLAAVADVAIASILQTTTTLTVETTTAHGLSVGKSTGIRGCIDARANYPALVVASVPSPTTYTATAGPGGTIASQSLYVTTVVAATTAPLPASTYNNGTAGVGATLTATANGAFPAQDGVTVALNQRMLVKNEATAANNGLYLLTTVGTAGTPWVLTRAANFDTAAEMLINSFVSVSGGTTQATRRFVLAATVTTVGTTAVTFTDLGEGSANNLGFSFFRERMGRAKNGMSQVFENATVTNASLYIRSEAGDALPSGTVAGSHSVTVGTTAPIQRVNSAYSYAFAPTTEFKMLVQADRSQWVDSAVDAVAQTASRILRTQVCPNPSLSYKLRMRAVNTKSLTVPVAQIVSAAKTGTTTATIVTDVAHGLMQQDPVVVYGIRDQAAASFPNLLTATTVASIVSPTSFTIVIGTASTVTSYGGYVARVNGGNLMSALGANAVVAQSATLSTLSDGTRQLVLTGSTNWAGLSIGDMAELVGVRDNTTGATLNIDGPWKVANSATTSLTLVLPFAGQRVIPADFASTNCGGGVIKRTCLRMSFVRVFDFQRQRVELLARPAGDMAASAPVVLQGGTTAVTGSLTSAGTVSTVTSANLGIPGTVADVASAAITTTATVAAITPGFGTSYQVNIPVTVVTGTNPTMDVSIEESDDSGTNWFKVYDFPRITAVGMYRSPTLPLTGNRVRYVQTIGGTSPSFTRAINRLQSSQPADALRQIIDRSIVLTTLNSATPALTVLESGNRVKLAINVGAITTTAPALQLEGTEDGGASWVAIGSPLTAVASSTVSNDIGGANWQQIRARVSTAGVGVTAGYVLIKAHD